MSSCLEGMTYVKGDKSLIQLAENRTTKVSVPDFCMTSITNGQYANVTGEASPASLSRFGGAPQQPLQSASWAQAQRYCQRIGGRLPTEAEWRMAFPNLYPNHYLGRYGRKLEASQVSVKTNSYTIDNASFYLNGLMSPFLGALTSFRGKSYYDLRSDVASPFCVVPAR